jgi:D-sedoheptulose 7-phosphate isomerase
MKKEEIKEQAKVTAEALGKIDYAAVESVGHLIAESIKKGGKLLVAGNGGSAADSQHFAAELVCKFLKDRKGIPAIALTTNSSVVTAWSNDVGFDTVFARQIEALGKKGDVFVGITTSGNSPNIIEAFRKCKGLGITAILLEGAKPGKAEPYADIIIRGPSTATPRIQECHIFIIHTICQLVEDALYG